MSGGLDWQWPLSEGEMLRWQGRPAPRCYVWKNWKQMAVGIVLFLASSFWLMLAYELYDKDGYPWWLLLIPVPLVLLSLWFGPVKLLTARVRWEKLFYALTDQRLLIRDGLFSAAFAAYPLADLKGWKQKKFSDQLISLRLEFHNRTPLVLHCLEQPAHLLDCLQTEIDSTGSEESV